MDIVQRVRTHTEHACLKCTMDHCISEALQRRPRSRVKSALGQSSRYCPCHWCGPPLSSSGTSEVGFGEYVLLGNRWFPQLPSCSPPWLFRGPRAANAFEQQWTYLGFLIACNSQTPSKTQCTSNPFASSQFHVPMVCLELLSDLFPSSSWLIPNCPFRQEAVSHTHNVFFTFKCIIWL